MVNGARPSGATFIPRLAASSRSGNLVRWDITTLIRWGARRESSKEGEDPMKESTFVKITASAAIATAI
jgi:hypothetical protein